MGLYQEDFHYYVVYYMAYLAFGSAGRANSIAYASQFVDDFGATRPALFNSSLNRHLHFQSLPDQVVDPDNAMARHLLAAAMKSRNEESRDLRVGIALHGYADTFSHKGFSGGLSVEDNLRVISTPAGPIPLYGACALLAPFGHLQACHEVDLPFLQPQKAASAAIQIYRVLRYYAESSGNVTSAALTELELTVLEEDLIQRFKTFTQRKGEKRARAWFDWLVGEGIPVVEYDKDIASWRYEGKFYSAAQENRTEYWWAAMAFVGDPLWNSYKILDLPVPHLGTDGRKVP